MSNQSVYIIDALRSPMGRVNGKLRTSTPSDLVCAVIKALKVESIEVDEVVFGNAVSAGAGQNFIRKSLINAGLSETVPGYIVGNVCASGLQAVINASQAIRCSDADIVVAGGVESVSNMPELVFKKNHDIKKMKGLTESLMHDGLWCSVVDRWMGLICEDLARKENISKKEQDDYAFESYQKAAAAQKRGDFSDEIISFKMVGAAIYDVDETIRQNIKRVVFDTFESAFEHKGTITAANSAAPCDGAAGVLLSSQNAVDIYSFKPLAKIISCISIGGSARDVFRLVIPAIQACLKKAQVSLSQIDLIEISEAFAAQMLLVQRDLKLPDDRLNIYGGDIALGHPLGAAGIRSLVTIAHALKRKRKRYGLVCACLGGGGAIAVIIERE